MTSQIRAHLQTSLIAFVIALATAGIATPLALSYADDRGDSERQAVSPLNVAQGTAFSYQGRLEVDGVPASGTYDFEFRLFDDGTPGAPDVQVGATVPKSAVTVTNGLFAVDLDFGTTAFAGSQRWLDVQVKEAGGPTFAALGQRQLLNATPYALFSFKTAPHTHIGEDWMDSRTRSGTFGGNGILNLTNLYQPAIMGQLGGIGVRGSAVTAGIGVYGSLIQAPGAQPGIDLNSLVGGVVGYDRTQPCDYSCVGVKGFANGGTGQSIGVFGSGSTYGVFGSSQGVGVRGMSINEAGVQGESTGATGVRGTSTSGFGVTGTSSGNFTSGVFGKNTLDNNGTGVRGESIVGGTDGIGVLGVAGAQPPVRPNTTGVYGYANAENSTGVYGRADGLNAAGIKGVANTSQEFAGYFQGKVYVNGGLLMPSDLRLKHDILALPYGLDAVRALKPVSFVMNDDDSNARRLGLIAQDVQAVIPELVQTDSQSGLLSMTYLELIPVLVNAIKEQQTQIEALQPGATIATAAAVAPATARDDWPLAGAITFFGLGLFAVAGALWRLPSRREAVREL